MWCPWRDAVPTHFESPVMLELAQLFLFLGFVLAVWDRSFWLLSILFPKLDLFRRLQLPQWKWPWR